MDNVSPNLHTDDQQYSNNAQSSNTQSLQLGEAIQSQQSVSQQLSQHVSYSSPVQIIHNDSHNAHNDSHNDYNDHGAQSVVSQPASGSSPASMHLDVVSQQAQQTPDPIVLESSEASSEASRQSFLSQ